MKYKNLSKKEWFELKAKLDTNTPWDDEQWKLASNYLEDQRMNNIRTDKNTPTDIRATENGRNPRLWPQAQEIEKLAINQFIMSLG